LFNRSYAAKNNYPHLQHVTLPRIGAFKSILEVIAPKELGGEGGIGVSTSTDAGCKQLVKIHIF
jgi:hypothetical protein